MEYQIQVFLLLQEFVKLGYPKAVHRISMSYYDTGLDVCGGDVVVFKPSLLFFLVQSEQLKQYKPNVNLFRYRSTIDCVDTYS